MTVSVSFGALHLAYYGIWRADAVCHRQQFWLVGTRVVSFLRTSLLCGVAVGDQNYMHVPLSLGHGNHALNNFIHVHKVLHILLIMYLLMHNSCKQRFIEYLSTMGQLLAKPWGYKIWNRVSFLGHRVVVRIDNETTLVQHDKHLNEGIYQRLEER